MIDRRQLAALFPTGVIPSRSDTDKWDRWSERIEENARRRFGHVPRLFVSQRPFTGMRNIHPEEQPTHAKPKGLWYSCGVEWITWVIHEMPAWLDQMNYIYEIVVEPTRVLHLQTVPQLHAFTQKFGGRSDYEIAWYRVAEQWDGIEICPYQWDVRFDLNWYYPWDVASGCIWNKHAIVATRLLAGPGS